MLAAQAALANGLAGERLQQQQATPCLPARVLDSSGLKQQHRRVPGSKEWESRTGKNARDGFKQQQLQRGGGGEMGSIIAALDSSAGLTQPPWVGELQGKQQSILLKQVREWRKALKVFSWLEQQERHKPDVFVYNILLRTLGRAQQWAEVRAIWERMLQRRVEPSNVTYSTLVDAYSRAGLTQEALCFYRHMQARGLQPDEVMVSTLVNLRRRCGDVGAAEQALRALGGRKARNPETYNTLVSMYGEQGRCAEAARVVEEMVSAGVEPTTVTLNALVSAVGKQGQAGAQQAERMVAAARRRGCAVDVATYNTLVAAYARCGDAAAAAACVGAMRGAGIEPDQVTHRTLIAAHLRAGSLAGAEQAGRDMQEAGYSVDGGVRAAMVQAYIRLGPRRPAASGDPDPAVLLHRLHQHDDGAEEGEGSEPGLRCYVTLLDAYARSGCLAEAERVFSLALERHKAAPAAELARLYNVMIKAVGLCSSPCDSGSSSGKARKALEVVERMEAAGVAPNRATFNSLIQLLCAEGQAEGVDAVVARMRAARCGPPSLACYSSMIRAYGCAGRVPDAERAFKEMEQEAGIKADRICFTALLNVYVNACMVAEAQRTLRAMDAAGLEADVVVQTSLMKLYRNLGLVEEAARLYREMARLGLDKYASNTMLDVYVRAGMAREAEALFRAAMESGGGVDEVACTMMINLYREQRGRLACAVSLAALMAQRGLLSDAASFAAVVAVYLAARLMPEALATLRRMRTMQQEQQQRGHRSPPGSTMMRRLLACCRQVADAAGLPNQWVEQHLLLAAPTTTSPAADVLLCSLYARADMHEEALQLAMSIVQQQQQEELDVTACNALIFAFGNAGRLDAALRVYTGMLSRGMQLNEASYSSLIAGYGRAGLLEGVSRMFERLKAAGMTPSMGTYKAVVDVYRKAGRMDLASSALQEMHFAQYVQAGGALRLPLHDGRGQGQEEGEEEQEFTQTPEPAASG